MDAKIAYNEMMGKGIFFLATLVSMTLAVGMGVINLTPPLSDPHAAQVRSFLTPPQDCVMPCWSGIRPGITTEADALASLAGNPLIVPESVIARPNMRGTAINWDWRPDAPDFVNNPTLRAVPHVWIDDNIVEYILLPTQIPFGDVWEVMGEPQSGMIAVRGLARIAGAANTLHTATYFDGQIVFDGLFACPVIPVLFWGAPMQLTLYSERTTPVVRRLSYPLPERLYQPPCKV